MRAGWGGPHPGNSQCSLPTRLAFAALCLGNPVSEPAMTQVSTASLIDRTGLDRVRLKHHLARGFEGADDGELFLEYRQSEALVFDNGRLKQATYDTAQGFGLRAVKADAVGYAHA